jgi:sulfite exporter TauE/SafE
MLFLLAAISLGFLGSFHCIGMCGPIALALPIGNLRGFTRLISVLTYNAGRIFTYAFFGLIFGGIGKTFSIFGYQQLLSIVLGALILLGLLLPSSFVSKFSGNTQLYSFFNGIKTKLSKLFLKEGKKSLFIIGLLNGLLPCGLVYMAVAGAMAAGSVLNGALFMAFFGLGTAPTMILLPLAGNSFSLSFRNKIRKTVPYMVGFMAVLLILRGLNLGIPYVSPKMEANKTQLPTCHTIAGKKLCTH